jgi:hypothetical protein
MKEDVTFWFTLGGTRLKEAIGLMIQTTVILIADRMRLRTTVEETDIGVIVPLTRVSGFIKKLHEVGVPISLCGVVDCSSSQAATSVEKHGFESEII